MPRRILAIESSCDENAAAVVENGTTILSNVVASQIESHQRFGGVVPELASRHHVEQITYIIQQALDEAGVTMADVDAVAVTQGPGLVGALLVGISAAKALAFAHDLPLIVTNHIAGHIFANRFVHDMTFPALALVVSGGHTELVYLQDETNFELLGETRDDAVGECYDKVGRVMGLPYPAGKAIDDLARDGQDVYDFPRAMIKDDHYDFSFSGLKSAFINKVHNAQQRGESLDQADLAASFQAAAVDVLVAKTLKAKEAYAVNQVIVCGGVAANSGLRKAMKEALADCPRPVDLLIPPLDLCGDNAAMIGAAADIQYVRGDFADYGFNALPGMDLYD